MHEVGIAVGITKAGNVGWVMTPDFEAEVWAEIQRSVTDDELFDEVQAARRQAGLS